MPAKGKTTEFEGVSVLRFRDGKIAAERDFWNVADLLRQIGAAQITQAGVASLYRAEG